MLRQICAALLNIRLCILVIFTPYKSVVDIYTVFICGHHQSIESNIDLDVLIFWALFFWTICSCFLANSALYEYGQLQTGHYAGTHVDTISLLLNLT